MHAGAIAHELDQQRTVVAVVDRVQVDADDLGLCRAVGVAAAQRGLAAADEILSMLFLATGTIVPPSPSRDTSL